MKRGTPRHRKMRDLAKRLNIPLAHAVGIMEMLWHWAGQETPQGDIGTAADREIAAAVDWVKKPSILIAALVDSGWLDPHPVYRLVVHDWAEHAEQAVKKWLERKQQNFIITSGQNADIVQNLSGQDADELQQNVSPRAHARPGLAGLGSSSVSVSVSEGECEGEHANGWKPGSFEHFWSVVWWKKAQGAAKRAWKAHVKGDALAVIEAAQAQGPGIIANAAKRGITAIHPATWLNQERWQDEAEPQVPKSDEEW